MNRHLFTAFALAIILFDPSHRAWGQHRFPPSSTPADERMFNAKPSCQPTQQTPIEHPIAHRRRLPHRTSNLEVLKAEIERLRAQVEWLQRMIAEMKRERSEISLTASSSAETSQRDSRISEKLPDGEQRDSPETSRRASTVPRTVRPASTDRSDMKKRLTGDGRRSSAEGQRDLSSHVVHIGGYGSLRFEANNIDLGTPLGTLPRVRRGFHSFDFRRFVLTTDITPADRLRIHSEIEFERLGKIEIERTAIPENRGQRHRSGTRFIQGIEGQSGSEIKIEQAWLQYDIASDQFGLRAGIVLPPLGRFNLLHDDDYWDIPRRTLVDRDAPVLPAETAWSELGAGILGTIPLSGGFIKYQAYIVNGVTLDFTNEVIASLRQGRNLLEIEPEIFFDSGPVNGSNTADAATWRLALSPRIGSEIAFSGYHGRYTPDYLNVRENINSFGIDGKLTLGSFEAEGEFIYTDYGRMQRVLDDLARQLVDVGAETSGDETEELESEVEAEFKGPLTNQRYGFWIDLKYRWRPRWLRESFLGRGFEDPQLIPIVRYERVWFNDLVRELRFADGIITNLTLEDISQDRLTIGLTYRPIPSIPISLAYEHNHRRKGRVLVYPDILGSGRLSDRSFDTILFGIAFGF